jgi:GH25 family lysozyme M1 (1,4-beta-N-acetylmuramidase)
MSSRFRRAVASLFLVSVLLGSRGTVQASGLSGYPTTHGAGSVPGATSSTLEGIDVSHWQGTIDWTKVSAAGKRFVIMKATDGTTFIDPQYATNHARARAAGLRTTAYHFARPSTTAGDAVAEADHLVAVAGLGDGDMIPALDLETTGGLGTAALQSWVASWLHEVTARIGVRPMIYTSPNFWKTYMGDTRSFADAGYTTLWIAHWNVASPTVPAQNWGGHGWTFWQYSDCGTVPGISGCVDLDRYNGTDLTRVLYDPGYKLSTTPGSQSVKQGRSTSYSIAVKRTNFPSPVDLSITGLPTGATATFAADPATGTSATLTVTTSNVSTVTPVGTYPLTITGRADGESETTSVTLAVSDGIAPTVTPPNGYLRAVGILGSATTPVTSRWPASDPSGILSYRLQRQVNGGSWSSVSLPSATTTAINQALTINATYRYRVLVTDRAGNATAWVAGRAFVPRRTQQSSSSIVYHGTWHTVSTTSASGGSLKYATAAGASATYTFSGSNIAWVASRGPSRGSAKVYIDGVYTATVSLYKSTSVSRSLVYAKGWATNGTHTIKIVVVGTAGHPRVDIDAFVRLIKL